MPLASETLNIVLNVDGVTKAQAGLEKAENSVTRVDRAGAAVIKTFTRYKGLLLGIATGVGLAAVKSQLDFADQIGKTAQRIGASTEALSEYKFVAEQSGVAFDTLTTAWQRQTRRISEAAQGTGVAKKALEELQIPVKDLISLRPEDQFERIAESLVGLPNQADQVRLAMALWDTEGVKLVQTLADGTEGIAQMRKRARELGLTLSEDATKQAAAFNDSIGELGAAFTGLIQQITLLVGPPLTAFFKFITDSLLAIPKIIAAIKAWAEGVGLLKKQYVDLTEEERQSEIDRMTERVKNLQEQLDGRSAFSKGGQDLAGKLQRAKLQLAELKAVAQNTVPVLDKLDDGVKKVAESVTGGGSAGTGLTPAVKESVNQLDLWNAALSFDDVFENHIRQQKRLADAQKEATAQTTKETAAVEEQASAFTNLIGIIGGLGLTVPIGGGATISTGILSQLAPLLSGGGLGPLASAGLGAGFGGLLGGGSQGAVLGGGLGAGAGALGGSALITALLAGGPPTAAIAGILPFIVPGLSLAGGLGGGFLGGKLFGGKEDKPKIKLETRPSGSFSPTSGRIGSSGVTEESDLGQIIIAAADGGGRQDSFFDAVRALQGIDNAIAGLLTGEQLGRARTGAQSFAESTRASNFDFEETLAGRYTAIFAEVGGALNDFFEALDPNSKNIRNVLAAVTVFDELGETGRTLVREWDAADEAFQASLQAYITLSEFVASADPIGKINDGLEELARGPQASLNAALTTVTELSAQYTGTAEQTLDLAFAVGQLGSAQVAAIAAIRSAQEGIADTTESTVRSIERMGLVGEELFDFEFSRAQQLAGQLSGLDEASEIQNTIREINNLSTAALNAVRGDEAQFAKKRAEILDFILLAQGVADQRLEQLEQSVRDSQVEASAAIQLTMESAATALINAGSSMARSISRAADRIQEPPQVIVNVETTAVNA